MVHSYNDFKILPIKLIVYHPIRIVYCNNNSCVTFISQMKNFSLKFCSLLNCYNEKSCNIFTRSRSPYLRIHHCRTRSFYAKLACRFVLQFFSFSTECFSQRMQFKFLALFTKGTVLFVMKIPCFLIINMCQLYFLFKIYLKWCSTENDW